MFISLGHVTPEQDHETLRHLAETAGGTGRVALEVGSWTGSTALTLAPFFDKLYCVDTFQGSDTLRPAAEAANAECAGVFRVFCHNMGRRLMTKVVPCVGTSLDWAYVWTFPVDLIFLDADHEYESVKADIEAWRPHCRQILCGHDYGTLFPGVQRAVDELFDVTEVNVRGNMWWVHM